MRPAMLLHVVFASECLVAFWAKSVLLARVFLSMSCCVARGGEEVGAANLLSHRAGILVLLLWLLIRLGR